MKLLTIAVPCYQSQDYMRNCIDTLIGGWPSDGDDIEILIIDDGSTDATGAIADALQEEYPGRIRAIHQENRGHGGAVMTGLDNATGEYFKVVDSDDWLCEKSLRAVLTRLRKLRGDQESVDAVLCNYVYEKAGAKHKRAVRYTSVFPEGKICTWEDAGRFRLGEYILMHSVIFRTDLLRESGLELPRHTFYVDNIFVYQPMQYVKTLLYLDLDLYHYFIGRDDQSVNERVMISRIDQQIRVNKLMLECFDGREGHPEKLREAMGRYLAIVTAVSTVLLFREGGEDSLEKKKELWRHIRQNAPRFYDYFPRHTPLGFILQNDGMFSRKLALLAYKLSRKLIGYN